MSNLDKISSSVAFLKDGISNAPEQKLLELIDKGWEAFYREIFGDGFVDILDSQETDDRHHSEAISWHWEARLALLRGERPPNDYFAYFPTWARSNMKTTCSRKMLITDAMLSFAFGQPGYALIPGGTKNKIRGSAMSVEKMLHDEQVVKYCPALSQVDTNMQGRSRGWTASYISTQARYVFHFIGLEEGVAGANLDNVRPTGIWPDDIDTRDQSPVEAETRFRVFTTEVLPTRQSNTLVFWAQNIINRYSVRYRIEKQHVQVLTNRKPTQPIPAIRGLETEQRVVNGIIKNIIVAGKCTWRGWDLERAQDEINTYGLPAFMAEMQHDVEASDEGLILHNWRDETHVISESEFESVYKTRKMPVNWPKEWANDWARTKTARHANVALWRTVSPQNSKLPGFQFIFHPMSFPANSQVEDVAERLLSCLENGAMIDGKQVSWQDMRRDVLTRSDSARYANTGLERMELERSAVAEVFLKYTEPLLRKHRVLGGMNSHERDDIRKIYNHSYGLKCGAANPGKYGGIEQINRDLMIDWNEDHPFRPGIKGYTRTFLVVPDDTTQEPSVVNGVKVYPPKKFTDSTAPEALHDDELFRYQIVNWRTIPERVTITGAIIDVPEKANDDFLNSWQFLAALGPLKNAPLSIREEFEALLPEGVMDFKAMRDEGKPITREYENTTRTAAFFARAELETKYGENLDEELENERYNLEDEDLIY